VITGPRFPSPYPASAAILIETRHSDFGRWFFLVLLGIGWLSTGALAPGNEFQVDPPPQSTYSEWTSPLWTAGFQRSVLLGGGEQHTGRTDLGPVPTSGRAGSIQPAAVAPFPPVRAMPEGLGSLDSPARAPPS
jgi:hypothetical protein